MLELSRLEAGYGKKVVLQDISLEVKPREIVALIGPNGAGKSTVLKAIFGIVRVSTGRVIFQGEEIQNRKPVLNVRAGLSYVPQGSRVFTELTVIENLEMGGYILDDRTELNARIAQVIELFPFLRERQDQNAGSLSGGEKQMLALSRALILKPNMLLLDEPSLGLSSKSAKIAIEIIQAINEKLNTTILLVEQNVREVVTVANRVYIMKLGRVVFHDLSKTINTQEQLRDIFLF